MQNIRSYETEPVMWNKTRNHVTYLGHDMYVLVCMVMWHVTGHVTHDWWGGVESVMRNLPYICRQKRITNYNDNQLTHALWMTVTNSVGHMTSGQSDIVPTLTHGWGFHCGRGPHYGDTDIQMRVISGWHLTHRWCDIVTLKLAILTHRRW